MTDKNSFEERNATHESSELVEFGVIFGNLFLINTILLSDWFTDSGTQSLLCSHVRLMAQPQLEHPIWLMDKTNVHYVNIVTDEIFPAHHHHGHGAAQMSPN